MTLWIGAHQGQVTILPSLVDVGTKIPYWRKFLREGKVMKSQILFLLKVELKEA